MKPARGHCCVNISIFLLSRSLSDPDPDFSRGQECLSRCQAGYRNDRDSPKYFRTFSGVRVLQTEGRVYREHRHIVGISPPYREAGYFFTFPFKTLADSV